MCVYGIGLPFDHPIWQNLPPCHCGVKFGPSWDQRLDYIRKPKGVPDAHMEAIKRMLLERPCCDDPEHMGHGGIPSTTRSTPR